jgi:hypothetical protein
MMVNFAVKKKKGCNNLKNINEDDDGGVLDLDLDRNIASRKTLEFFFLWMCNRHIVYSFSVQVKQFSCACAYF